MTQPVLLEAKRNLAGGLFTEEFPWEKTIAMLLTALLVCLVSSEAPHVGREVLQTLII